MDLHAQWLKTRVMSQGCAFRGITRSHGSDGVLRTTTQVNGKVGNSTPAPSKTTKPIVT